jgi:hypothetical protein
LRAKLEALEEDVRGRSDALGRAGGRTAELWGVVGRVKAQKEAGLLHGTGERGGWAVVDPAAFEEIKAVRELVDFNWRHCTQRVMVSWCRSSSASSKG